METISTAEKHAPEALTVLLVDDDALPRRALARTLQHEGLRVESVDGAAAALDLLSHQRFDLVISDHMMPDVSGIELLRRVAATYPQTIRVISTGSANPVEISSAQTAGDVHIVLLKPWSLQEVRDVLQEARRRAAGSPGAP